MGTANHYWPWAVLFGQRTRRGQYPIEQRGEFPSVRGGQGLSKGRQGLAGGGRGWLEPWNKGAGGLERVSKGLGGWSLERAEGLRWGGGGWTLRGRDGQTFACSFVWTEIPPSVL